MFMSVSKCGSVNGFSGRGEPGVAATEGRERIVVNFFATPSCGLVFTGCWGISGTPCIVKLCDFRLVGLCAACNCVSSLFFCLCLDTISRSNLANGSCLEVVKCAKFRFVLNARTTSRFRFIMYRFSVLMCVRVAITNADLLRGDRVKGGSILFHAGVRTNANGRSQACFLVLIERLGLRLRYANEQVSHQVGRTSLTFRDLVAMSVRLRVRKDAFLRLNRMGLKCVSRGFSQDGLFGNRRQVTATVRVTTVMVTNDCRPASEARREDIFRRILVDDFLRIVNRLYDVPFQF